MGDVNKATQSLAKGGTLGGETDLIFDGKTVRQLTADDKKAIEKDGISAVAGLGVTTGPTEITVEPDNSGKKNKK